MQVKKNLGWCQVLRDNFVTNRDRGQETAGAKKREEEDWCMLWSEEQF